MTKTWISPLSSRRENTSQDISSRLAVLRMVLTAEGLLPHVAVASSLLRG
jgi:hypothetical protein